jgi:hypothetical protein
MTALSLKWNNDIIQPLFGALAFSVRFEPSQLEAQCRASGYHWHTGCILDFQVVQASAMCQGAGITATFESVRVLPYAISAG